MPTPKQLALAVIGYDILSLFIMVAAFEANKAFAAILVCINILLPTLAISLLKKGKPLGEISHQVAARSELRISLLGFNAAGAVFLDSYSGRMLLPLGSPMGRIRKGPAKAPTV